MVGDFFDFVAGELLRQCIVRWCGRRRRGEPVDESGQHVEKVQVGLDVLEAERFAPLRGKRVGLITNHTGMDASGRSTVDVVTHTAGVKVVALFSPEHGLADARTTEWRH